MTMLKMTNRQGIDHLVEIEIHLKKTEILEEILDKIIEEYHETIIEMTTDKTITEETTEWTVIENKGIEIGGAVDIIAGIPIETEKSQERTICKVEIIVGIGVGQDNHALKRR